MRFVDYKCKDCGEITEIVLRGQSDNIICGNCNSDNMVKIFSPITCKGAKQDCSGNCSGCSGGCS